MIEDNKAQLDNLEAQLNGDAVPEKFRGKTVKDVLTSYRELETGYSRQGAELGEARRLAVSLSELPAHNSRKDEPARTPVDTDALLADPDKAINEAIEAHPKVKQASERTAQLERDLAIAHFEKKHPSFRETATNAEFKQWVESNSALSRVAAAADRYDLDAADTLFSLWDERQGYKANQEKERAVRDNKAKKERAGTLEGSSGADSSTEVVYNRAEMQELHRRALLGDPTAKAKWGDPKFQAARRAAYRDGRVS